MSQLQSQLFGISLALMTALGCMGYERIAKTCSFFTTGTLAILAYVPFVLFALKTQTLRADYQKLIEIKWWVLLYIISGVTGILWYVITKKQSVMVGSIYEIKYIVILAIIYCFAGIQQFTWNIFVGIILAITSVYFISLSK